MRVEDNGKIIVMAHITVLIQRYLLLIGITYVGMMSGEADAQNSAAIPNMSGSITERLLFFRKGKLIYILTVILDFYMF